VARPVTEAVLLLLALALVFACGAFVAAEFSFVTVDRASVERASEAGDAGSAGLLAALSSLSTQLSSAQLGITVTNLLIGYLSEPAIADIVRPPLEDLLGIGEGSASAISLVIAIVLATGVTMVLGELVPKNLAIARPLATAKAVQGFSRGFTRAAGPAVDAFNATANSILRRIGVEPTEELASARAPEELASLVARSAEMGTLEHDTADLLQRSLAFGDRRAEDVMTPRVRMRALRPDQPVAAVIELARVTGLSRFPVLDGPDSVAGIVHVKRAVGVAADRRAETPVRDVMSRPVVVPESLALDPLLDLLRAEGLQMAVVADEFGGVAGLVTLEDVVEEIVGDVVDEHDRRDPAARPDGDGGWVLSGLLRPDEAGPVIGVVLPEDAEYETLGGLLALHLEHLPRVGESVTLDVETPEGEPRQVTLAVARVDGLRVDRVSARVAEPTPTDPAADE
jgi:CBS domain containing-hemolysin-like protein